MADDDEGGVWSGGEIYQLRVVIAGISPLIWRRLLVAADTTIAELHTILQTVFGWSGEHLHRFVIHGTDYGISYAGSEGFRDDARTVRLDTKRSPQPKDEGETLIVLPRKPGARSTRSPWSCKKPPKLAGSPGQCSGWKTASCSTRYEQPDRRSQRNRQTARPFPP